MFPIARSLTKEIGITLGTFVVALVYLLHWHSTERQEIEKRFIQDQLASVADKRAAIEGKLSGIYQNIRTITLLPSVKSIKGGNRNNEKEDIVATGRFSPEGHATVQQIYNNLASRVSVSEVYAVIDGLEADKGQVPFFMFDTMVFGNAQAEQEEAKPADFPEESEDAEYSYFPRQIEAIKSAHPRFDFAAIDDIPAYFSPLMRTCDNTQYVSRKNGSEKETNGLLYSVPFYDQQGEFRGVISAILRANVLEALLMGVPFVPVTEKDRAEQTNAKWVLPEPARYLLSNEKYGIRIADRRNADLANQIAQGVPGRNVFRVKVDVPSDAPWELTYYLPESMIEAAVTPHNRSFMVLLLVVLGAIFAAGAASVLLSRMRERLGGKTEEVARIVRSVSNGDLNLRVAPDVVPASVLGSMQAMVDELTQHMRAIDVESKQIAQSSYQISEISEKIVESSQKEQTHSEEVREATVALVETSASVRELSDMVSSRADQARDSAKEGMQAVRSNMEEMTQVISEVEIADAKIQELSEANKQIHVIVQTIASITDQTSLLALNAAIESARAGEQGRGFAVVADEVRKLAQNASNATTEISGLIDNLTSLVAENTKVMRKVIERARISMKKAEGTNVAIEHIGKVIDDNVEVAHRISVVSSEQQTKLEALQVRLGALSDTLADNAMKVHTTGAIGQDLFHVTEHLRQLIQHFRFDSNWVDVPIANEHRKVPRISNHLLVRLDDQGSEREAITADFSLSGMRLRVPQPLKSNASDTLRMRIMMPADGLDEYEHQNPLEISGRVLWTRDSDEGVLYGVEFQAVGAQQSEQLARCFAFFNHKPTYS